MEIKIGNFRINVRLEILFLMGVMMWIIACHLFFSCTHLGIEEGFEIAKQIVDGIKENNVAYGSQFQTYQSPWKLPKTNPPTGVSPAVYLAVYNDVHYADDVSSDLNTKFNNAALKLPEDYNTQYQVPAGDLDMLASSSFKPECCPNSYSNNKGCFCPTEAQYKFIKQRGNNNVPIAEY